MRPTLISALVALIPLVGSGSCRAQALRPGELDGLRVQLTGELAVRETIQKEAAPGEGRKPKEVKVTRYTLQTRHGPFVLYPSGPDLRERARALDGKRVTLLGDLMSGRISPDGLVAPEEGPSFLFVWEIKPADK